MLYSFQTKLASTKIVIDDHKDMTLYRPDLDKYNFNTTPDSLCYVINTELRNWFSAATHGQG
jgi:hypothetical protein